MLEWQCRGDIVVVLPQLKLMAMDVAVRHPSAGLNAAQADKQGGCTAARAEQTKRTWFRDVQIMLRSGLYYLQRRVQVHG